MTRPWAPTIRTRSAILMALLVLGCGEGGPSAGSGAPTSATEADCDVVFSLTTQVELRILELTVDYSRAPGMFVGDGRNVDCVALIKGTGIARNNFCRGAQAACPSGPDRHLYISILGNPTFVGPSDVARCRFVGARALEPNDLDVELREASNQAGDLLRARVGVGQRDCRIPSTSSTTSTSTTLLACSEECPSGSACIDGECIAVDRYEMDFSVEDAVSISALQLAVGYDPAHGAIVGEREDTQCWPDASLNTLTDFNNDYDEPCGLWDPGPPACFVAAIITPTGIQGPTRLFTCLIDAPDTPPLASDFTAAIVDVSTGLPIPQPLIPPPTIVISAIRPVAP